ncbi:hypothetical protein [Pontibacter toksunensis]
MLILKYSYLNRNMNLVKVLHNEKYGIYDLAKSEVLTEPQYDVLQYLPELDAIVAKKDGYYFYIDVYGNLMDTVMVAEQDWGIIDKNDTCPACFGHCCSDCHGFGIVSISGSYDELFNSDM